MTALEYIGIAIIAVLCIVIVLLAAQFSKALSSVLEHADQIHVRSQMFQDKLLDRLMAVDYTTFKAYSVAEESDVGGWEPPEELKTAEEILDATGDDEVVSLTGLHLPPER